MKKADMVTKKDFLNELAKLIGALEPTDTFFNKGETAVTYADTVTFLEKEIGLLDKKSEYKSTKPTKNQAENEALKAEILRVLGEAGKALSIKEMTSTETPLQGLSSSKMSALLTQLRNGGEVVRNYDKKTAIFSLAE